MASSVTSRAASAPAWVLTSMPPSVSAPPIEAAPMLTGLIEAWSLFAYQESPRG